MTDEIKIEETNKMPGKNIIKGVLIGLGILLIVLAIFWTGMLIGFRKAGFSYQWGENYHNIFGAPRRGFNPPPPAHGDEFINPNSAAGAVIKVENGKLYLKGDDNVEKSVLITSSTVIRQGRESIMPKDLKTDDEVVVLGVPSSTGQIEAKFIRVFGK